MQMKIHLGVPAEHVQHIGQITINFATLEGVTAFLAWSLINSTDQRLGRIITAGLSFRNVVTLVSSLSRHRFSDPELIASLDTMLKRALTVEEKRNVVIHSAWLAGNAPGTARGLKTQLKYPRDFGFSQNN